MKAREVAASSSGPQELPDTMPSVSFDIRLGKQYKEVDFDFAAFSDLAEKLNLDKETVGNLNIEVTRNKWWGITGGIYSHKQHKIELSAGKDINNRLGHELGHAAVYQDGGGEYGFRAKLGTASMMMLAPTTAIYGGSFALGEMGNKTAEIFTIAMTPSLAAVVGTAIACYYMDPQEKRARKAGKDQGPSEVITLRK